LSPVPDDCAARAAARQHQRRDRRAAQQGAAAAVRQRRRILDVRLDARGRDAAETLAAHRAAPGRWPAAVGGGARSVSQESGLRVVIAGGGTGGHLFPGLAIAREILARRPYATVTFAGTARGIEARAVPAAGFALDTIRSLGLKGKSLLDRGRGVVTLPLSAVDAMGVIARRRPH